MTTWTILGTSEIEECWHCGKKNLKKTIALTDGEGEVRFVGTECAKRLTGRSGSYSMKKAEEIQRAADHRKEQEAWGAVMKAQSYPFFRALCASKDFEAAKDMLDVVATESKVERSEILRQIALRWAVKLEKK